MFFVFHQVIFCHSRPARVKVGLPMMRDSDECCEDQSAIGDPNMLKHNPPMCRTWPEKQAENRGSRKRLQEGDGHLYTFLREADFGGKLELGPEPRWSPLAPNTSMCVVAQNAARQGSLRVATNSCWITFSTGPELVT